jgi:ferrochelatase
MQKSPIKQGVILVNLGSPTAPEPAAIKAFLASFLSDKRVVEIPSLIWKPLLHGVILPLRAKRVAGLYHEIWTEQGSPLTAMTLRQVELLQALCPDVAVAHAMTYGQPSVASVIERFRAQGIESILLIPLYPQYSGTTTGAVYDQVAKLIQRSRFVPDVYIVRQYCEREDYHEALAHSIRDHWSSHGQSQKLLFSFHGIPQRCVDLGDPYLQQCQATAMAVATKLKLEDGQWTVAFQSRFGNAKWLQPYTDRVLEELPQQGIRSVDVVCPAFASDCLETLEEIEVGSRGCFMSAGGERFSRIKCLNDDSLQIQMLASIVKENLDYCATSCRFLPDKPVA